VQKQATWILKFTSAQFTSYLNNLNKNYLQWFPFDGKNTYKGEYHC